MIAILLLPVLMSGVLGLTARTLGRRLPPAVAARMLPAAAVGLALATGLALSVFAVLVAARFARVLPLADVDRVIHPSLGVLPWRHTVPSVLGPVAAVLVLGLVVAAAGRCVRLLRDLASARTVLADLGASGCDGVVVEDRFPAAVAIAGWRGHIVVSTGLLRGLDPPERVAVLAHERAHLVHRHHAWNFLAHLAAAADPLLGPVVAATAQSCERWADEDAATALGDRRVVASALARAALLRARTARAGAGSPLQSVAVCAAGGGDVVRRAEALLRPAPTARRLFTVAALALAVALTGGLVTAGAAGAEGVLDAALRPPVHCPAGGPQPPTAQPPTTRAPTTRATTRDEPCPRP